MSNKVICGCPFKEISTTISGKYQICSWSKETDHTVKDKTPMEFFHSDFMNKIRQDMNDGIMTDDIRHLCQLCIQLEKDEKYSFRQPPVDETELKYLYINHIGNYCNLKCVGCGPERSSMYGYRIDNWDFNNEKIYKELEQIKAVSLVGGEPFLMSSVKDMLKRLDGKCKFTLTSNSMQFPDYLLKLKHKKKIHVILSYDGVGSLDNYIRTNSNFSKKIKVTKKFVDNFECQFLFTVNILNYKYINETKEFIKNEFGHDIMMVNRLITPDYLDAVNLPINYKITHSKSEQLSDRFKNTKPNHDKFLEAFSFFKTHDAINKTNALEFIPEFEEHYKSALLYNYAKKPLKNVTDNVPPIEGFII